jgi:hypothetical protein
MRARPFACAVLAAAPLPAQAPDFARDVQPVLARHCYPCHGPDGKERKADLRLDSLAAASAVRKGGVRPITPGDAAHSELLRRIDSADADYVMPPPAANKALAAGERALLRAWIEAGADYAPHWAFVPPQKRPPPRAADESWCRDELDRFVLARLRREGLEPSPPADPATLLRRVHLGLTGLPPTPAEVESFAADRAPDAYERRVDDLLARPACAEHMAGPWLDLAHFADTFGYQADFECRTWPWRDWLLAALADDLPYDQFVRQVVAGDLLPDASQDTRSATAFFRLHRQTNEGGSIDEEWRQEYIADRVDTFGTAFLGLTVGCARCHDHKFDPVTQRDFYALGSFFAIDEAGLYPYSTGVTPKPALRLATEAQQAEIARLRKGVAAAEASFAEATADYEFAHPWFPDTIHGPPVSAPEPPELKSRFDELRLGRPVLTHRFDAVHDGKSAAEQNDKKPAEVPAGVRLVAGHYQLTSNTEPAGRALQFDGDAAVTVPDAPAFTRDDAFTIAFWLWCPDTKERAVVLHTSSYTEDADTQSYQVLIKGGRLCWEIVHHWPGSAIALRAKDALPLQRWVQVAFSYDGSSRAGGMSMWLDGEPVKTDVERDCLDGPATVRVLQLGGRDRDRGFAGGRMDDLVIWTRHPTPVDVSAPPDKTSDALQRALAALHDARKALHDCEDAIPELMVLAANAYPPERFVLKRGAYDQPDKSQPAPPDVPQALLPFDASWPRTRLGLTQWLLSPQNPLCARVQVNRLWAQCFGQGLVRTPENFGRLGEVPAQRELLDALAVDFIASGWRSKAMLRRIVTSATFCQQSAATDALRERDPYDLLLARGPSFRLPAETLRDQALAASGLLHAQLGGPSVKPWQPPGLWHDAGVAWGGADYKPDTGQNAHRRSLYSYRKRTAPPPDMLALDAPSREVCTARRLATDTPLQALVFLDDPVFVECAQALAARVQREQCGNGTPDADAAIAAAFTALTARPPRAAEAKALRALFDAQRAAFARDADACAKADDDAADPALAALALVCNALLASDQVTVLR